MSSDDELQKLRKKIDELDEKIQDLVSQRAQCALDIGKFKQDSDNTIVYRPEREASILEKVKQRNKGPIPDQAIQALFKEVMSICRSLEQKIKVAYLGPEGTYSQAAVYKQFGHAVNAVALVAIDEVFREVESGNCDYGLVPVENSSEGVVNHTLDMFIQSSLQICGEVELRIHHHLLSKADNMGKIKRVYSHQQSFAQCREWLNANLKSIELVSSGSNGEAARLASEDNNAAAIAGEQAGTLYGLTSLVKNIEDDPNNTTRFLVIGRQSPAASGKDKTSLLLSTRNLPGALYELLRPLADCGVSMSKIESRPSRKGAWDYVFFVDVEGHQDDQKLHQALDKLKLESALFKILGSYPRG